MPSPVSAETFAKIVSPPHSSGWRPSSTSSRLTRSGSAPGLSILLTATMIGTLAAFAWAMASLVCGITPSSAATTRMTMSVAPAPRARIAVNASWPGVSRNTIVPRRRLHLVRADVLRDAAGFAAGDVRLADLVEEGRLAVVDVTHDRDDRGRAHARRRPSSASLVVAARLGDVLFFASSRRLSTSQPNSLARIFAVSASSVELMWTPVMPMREELHEELGRLEAHLRGHRRRA